MGASSRVSFEVQVLSRGHWVIAELAGDEAKAVALAEGLVRAGQHSAVRVVRDYERLNGTHSENVVFERRNDDRNDQDITLSPISEAPLCACFDDFFLPAARLTIARLLRKYLDQATLTPTEFMHDSRAMKRFGDQGSLLFSALDRIASLQARALGERDPAPRKLFLERGWTELRHRARDFAALRPHPPADLASALTEAAGDLDPSYGVRARLTLALLERRGWLSKLDLLLGWAEEPNVEPGGEAIDTVVADLVMPSQMVQDLIGFQPNLAGAVGQIVDLAEGCATPSRFAATALPDLNRLFAAGRLPQAQSILLDRAVREVGGANPLSRHDPTQEYEVFQRLLGRMVGRERVAGSGAMAEALVRRATRVLSAGGASLSTAEALQTLIGALADGCTQVSFLLTLAPTPTGQTMAAALTDLLERKIAQADHIDQWCPPALPPRERMAALKATHQRLSGCLALAESCRHDLADRIDRVMMRYLASDAVIERLDTPDDPLAARAIRLVKFCGSGLLIEGRSLDFARARVISYLRQPQFEEKFRTGYGDNTQADRALRAFYRLLIESGFDSGRSRSS